MFAIRPPPRDDDPAETSGGAAARFRLRRGGRDVDVPAGGLVVGRGADCDLRLGGGLVSRRHARISPTPDGLLVEDLGSRNGVFVGGRRIGAPALVRHGDHVGIGVESLEVVDVHVLEHPEHLSTLPPPSLPASSIRGLAPPGEADVDAPDQPTLKARVDLLTEREREVLELVVLGHTQKEIAQKLHVSVKTVETHRAHISEKLRARTRAELVTYAISAGLLSRLLRSR